jgi:hypothetical protein
MPQGSQPGQNDRSKLSNMTWTLSRAVVTHRVARRRGAGVPGAFHGAESGWRSGVSGAHMLCSPSSTHPGWAPVNIQRIVAELAGTDARRLLLAVDELGGQVGNDQVEAAPGFTATYVHQLTRRLSRYGMVLLNHRSLAPMPSMTQRPRPEQSGRFVGWWAAVARGLTAWPPAA